jgi:lysophospholipase L1-like esterase
LLGAAAIAGCGSSGSGDDDDDGGDTGGDSGLHQDGGSDATTGGGDASGATDGGAGGDAGDATTGGGHDGGDGSTGDGGDGGSGDDSGTDGEAGPGTDAGDAGTDSGHDSGPDAGPTALIHYYGRFDTTDTYEDDGLGVVVTATPTAPVFDWSGSGIVASFTGTGIAVTLTAYPYSEDMGFNEMQVVVDGTAVSPTSHGLVLNNGGACKKTDVCTGTYTLTSGLADGLHKIELYKRTEANYGYIQFGGFKNVTGGSGDWALEASPDDYPRKLEFIGDSITAGYGVLGTNPCNDDGDVNDAYESYAGQTARALGASFVGIAFSGKGAYQDANGNTTTTGNPPDPELPALYPRTWENNSGSTYNFATPVDAVVINLGTNDYNQGYDPTNFVSAYEGLVATVRSHYPNAYILLIDGPLLSNNYPFTNAYDQLDTDLGKILTHFKNLNDTNMDVLEVPIQGDCSEITCGCDEHPTVSEDQSISVLIANKIKAAKGW